MKIAVLTSGGVDSSVALALLKAQGHDITAFYLKIWLEDELAHLGSCPWQEDLSYITQLCSNLSVPLNIIPLQAEYYDKVVSYTISAIKSGLTPNPDIFCNARIKFGAFMDAIDPSFTHIASGHYSQGGALDPGPRADAPAGDVQDGLRRLNVGAESLDLGKHRDSREGKEEESFSGSRGAGFWESRHSSCAPVKLRMAKDPVKDQTYFLAHLTQQQLQKLIFPIGHLMKSEVRELATKLNLPNQNRPDSQGICFLGKLKFNEFIKHHLGTLPGPIVDYDSRITLGEHQGYYFHTVGQRKGLGLSGGPWYVVDKDPQANTVYVSRSYFSSDKPRNIFTIKQPHWITTPPDSNQQLITKLRHGPETYNCTIKNNTVTIDGHDQGPAPGQFAVFYQNGGCLGCAEIDR